MLRTTVSGRPLPDAIESARSRLGAPDVLRLPLSEATGRTRRMTGLPRILEETQVAGPQPGCRPGGGSRIRMFSLLLRSPVFPSQSKWRVRVDKVFSKVLPKKAFAVRETLR